MHQLLLHTRAMVMLPMYTMTFIESFLSDIQSVQPSSSHPLGGELITITGSGFGLSCGLEVDIAGVPCEVVQSSFSEVKCVTGAAPAGHAAVSEDGTYSSVEEGYRFKGEVHIGSTCQSL